MRGDGRRQRSRTGLSPEAPPPRHEEKACAKRRLWLSPLPRLSVHPHSYSSGHRTDGRTRCGVELCCALNKTHYRRRRPEQGQFVQRTVRLKCALSFTMKARSARCTCEACAVWEEWREEQEYILDILSDENFQDDMISDKAQKKDVLTRRLINLNRLVRSLRHQNSRSAEDLDVAEAELESLQMHIIYMENELEKHCQAKEEAEAALRRYQAALHQANLELKQQQEEKARREAEAKTRAKIEEKRVRLLQLEVERNTHHVKEDKANAQAAVDQCKKMAQLLESQGLLTKELEEELAYITSLPMEPLTTIEVDSSSEMDASDEEDLGSQRMEELLAADEHKSPEPSLELCFSAVAEMKVPRALSPFHPSLPLAGRSPPLVASLAPVQSAPSLPALPAGEPPQLTCPSEPVQSIPVLVPVLTKQGPDERWSPLSPCKTEQSTTEQEPSTLQAPQPKKRRLAHSFTQVCMQDEQLSDGEVSPPSKKPLLSKHQMHQLFSSSSSGEEDEAEEEKNNEQSPFSTCPPCLSERAAATGRAVSANLVQGGEGTHGALSCGPLHVGTIRAVSGYLPSQGKLRTCGGAVRSPLHAGLNRALPGKPIQAKESQNMGMECSPASATAIKAVSGNLPSRGMLGAKRGVACSPVHAVSNKTLSVIPAQAREGQHVGIVHSPAPATVSKATSGSLSEGGQNMSPYSVFLRSHEHAATSRAAALRGQTSKLAQTVLGKLAFFATQPEVCPQELEESVRKVRCDQLVRGALNYLSECKANPVSAYCRGDQAPPLITKFENLLLQALAHKQNGWVVFLSALRARFWSRSQPRILMGRASYVRLIGALCCKLDEPTVAQILIWDLLGTNQAPFLVASVVGAWPGLLKALPPGVVQKTVAYLLLDSPAHTLNSTLEFQARQVLRTLGPLHGFVKYIPKQLVEELLAPLLSAHTCGDTCVMHHRSLQELCQRSPESLLPWVLEQQLAPQAELLIGSSSTGCLIFLLVSLWKMYKEPPKALESVFTQLLQRVKNKGLRLKNRYFLQWEGTREILTRNISGTYEASMAEPPPQEKA